MTNPIKWETHLVLGLQGRPFANKASQALARFMPLESDNDFEVFANLPANSQPIYVNFAEHYQLLADMVQRANSLWPEGLTVLVRLSMPGGMRLPSVLLAPNVLLLQDVSQEMARLKRHVPRLLVINDHLLRYQLEQGQNEMQLHFFSQVEEQEEAARFEKFIAPLDTHKLVRL